MKVVINICHGMFELSPKAMLQLMKLKNKPCYILVYNSKTEKYEERNPNEIKSWDNYTAFTINNPRWITAKEWPTLSTAEREDIHNYNRSKIISIGDSISDRADPDLINIVEELQEEAAWQYSKLKVVDVPDGLDLIICESSGKEWVAENHRTWE